MKVTEVCKCDLTETTTEIAFSKSAHFPMLLFWIVKMVSQE